jgi:hypothetical protein
VLAIALLVLASAWLRMAVARSDPGFQPDTPVGMLRSDPALLYYITERIVEAGGAAPECLRADPLVEHPRGADLLAEFAVGQEFLVAWTFPAFALGAPLHVHAQRVGALTASLTFAGVLLVARALFGRGWLALFSACLAALVPANYRTIGFVLVREDLSLPLFALHAGLAAAAWAAAGRRRRLLGLGAGVALAAALATWQALAFVASLEALALVCVCVLRGANPLADPAGRLALVPILLAAVLVPALRASGTLFSPPLLAAAALLFLARAERSRPLGAARRAALAGISLAVAGALAFLLARGGWSGGSELSHVYEVLLAKARTLGVKPTDPRTLSFDARLLWQGPFETLAPGRGAAELGLALILGVPGAGLLCRGARANALGLGLAVFGILALAAGFLIARMLVLAALALPVLAGGVLERLPRQRALGLCAAVLLVQGLLFARFAARHEISWYRPPGLAPELAALLATLPELVPPGEAVCADFVTSTAVLAHTQRPIVLQPKYETEFSRRTAEAFLATFFHGTPEELARLLKERFRCRYLLVDRYTLGYLSPWTAGLPAGRAPAPESAAAAFLSQDEGVLRGVPGFELLYRSPPTVLQSNGEPYDLYRLYQLD